MESFVIIILSKHLSSCHLCLHSHGGTISWRKRGGRGKEERPCGGRCGVGQGQSTRAACGWRTGTASNHTLAQHGPLSLNNSVILILVVKNTCWNIVNSYALLQPGWRTLSYSFEFAFALRIILMSRWGWVWEEWLLSMEALRCSEGRPILFSPIFEHQSATSLCQMLKMTLVSEVVVTRNPDLALLL